MVNCGSIVFLPGLEIYLAMPILGHDYLKFLWSLMKNAASFVDSFLVFFFLIIGFSPGESSWWLWCTTTVLFLIKRVFVDLEKMWSLYENCNYAGYENQKTSFVLRVLRFLPWSCLLSHLICTKTQSDRYKNYGYHTGLKGDLTELSFAQITINWLFS